MRPILLVGLLLISCRAEKLEPATATLTVSPGELDFGRVTIGGRRELEVVLGGRAEGSLTVAGPFALGDDSFTAPSTLRVSFAPDSEGVFTAHVEFTSSAGPQLVQVRGEGVVRSSRRPQAACPATKCRRRCAASPFAFGSRPPRSSTAS